GGELREDEGEHAPASYRRRARRANRPVEWRSARERGGEGVAEAAVRVDPGPRLAREAAQRRREVVGEPRGQPGEPAALREAEQLAILDRVAHELQADRLHRERVRAAEALRQPR